MKSHQRITSFLLSAYLASSSAMLSSAHAVTVNINEDNTSPRSVIGITGFSTFGDQMAGMNVTVVGLGLAGGQESAPWVAGLGGAGSATGTGWSLTETGDTFDTSTTGRWQFDTTSDNLQISRIVIDGFAATAGTQTSGTVFDRTNPSFGTDGSFKGRDFEIDAAAGDFDLNVTYRDPVVVGAAAAVGDIFRELDLQFIKTVTGGSGLFGFNDRLLFRQDTDTVGLNTGNPGGGPEGPEPASIVLLVIGAVALPLIRKRFGK